MSKKTKNNPPAPVSHSGGCICQNNAPVNAVGKPCCMTGETLINKKTNKQKTKG